MRTIQLRFGFLALSTVLMPRASCEQPATYTTLYSFEGGSDGANPYGGVSIGQDGVLYGTTVSGGSSSMGTVFKLTPAGKSWTETLIHTFLGSNDGAYPGASVVFGASQVLYGTTRGGGSGIPGSGAGTVFKLTPSITGEWTETILYAFDAALHSVNHTPQGTVLMGPGGTLYTTATSGTVVQVTPLPRPAITGLVP